MVPFFSVSYEIETTVRLLIRERAFHDESEDYTNTNGPI